jgi:hypothetical protein
MFLFSDRWWGEAHRLTPDVMQDWGLTFNDSVNSSNQRRNRMLQLMLDSFWYCECIVITIL